MGGATTLSIGLALGGGGARGFAHVLIFEALDELGLRPAIIAGTSIGAIAGAVHASGMSGRAMRELVLQSVAEPVSVARDLVSCRASGFDHVLSIVGNPMLLDAEKIATRFLPESLPEQFDALEIPLLVVATDYHARSTRVLDHGLLRPALAASMALPGLFQPVNLAGRFLIDGGVTNPVPFDLLVGRADIVIAVDVNGGPDESERNSGRLPRPLDTLFTSIQIMAHAIVTEKLARFAPAIVIRPTVTRYRLLDFLKAADILEAAAPAKEELKRALDIALAR